MTENTKPKRKPGPKPEVDWLALRNQFVYGTFDEHGNRIFRTLKELAESQENISVARIHQVARRGNRSVRGNWTEERIRVRHQLAEAVEAKRTNAAANAIVEMEARHLRAWSAMEASVIKKLFVVSNGVVAGFDPSLSMPDARALCEMLKTATSAQRVIMGVPETRVGVHEDEESELLKSLSDEDVAELAGRYARAISVEREEHETKRLPS